MENFDEYDLFEEYANILHDLSMEVDELTSVEELEEIISEMENVLMEAESDEDLSEEDYEELLALADGLISELYNDLLNLKKSKMTESKKIIRLTESDLIKLVKKVIKEQKKGISNTPLMTKFVQKFMPLGVNWKLAGPNDYDSKMAYVAKSNDLMIDGFEGKPLIFIHTKKPSIRCFLRKDGKTIMCSSYGDLKSFDITSQFGDFLKWISNL